MPVRMASLIQIGQLSSDLRAKNALYVTKEQVIYLLIKSYHVYNYEKYLIIKY